MRACIYGAGSLGTVLGAYISKAGVDIDLVNRNEKHVKALKEKGAHITGKVDFVQKVNAITPSEMTEKYDIIFLMTKQLDNRNVVNNLVQYLKDDGVICTMQNGLPEPLIGEIIGDYRTYGCAIGWGAQMTAPGVAELTSEPDSLVFALGSLDKENQKDAHFEEIKKLLSCMGKVELNENFLGVRWSKLVVNSAFSGLSTVLGCDFGGVADNKTSRLLAQRIIKEIIDLCEKGNIKIEPIQGKDVVKLLNYKSKFKQKISFFIIPIAIKKHRLIRASMLQDIENGKKCEVDAINGVVSEFGRKFNSPTPVNDKTVELIKQIEEGKLSPSSKNLQYYTI